MTAARGERTHHAPTDQAFRYTGVFGYNRQRSRGAALCRQGGGDHGDGMVGSGLRRGRRRLVQEARSKALTYPASAYKEGFVPPSAINWNDADDNNAFHAKTIVMNRDGSISTEVAIFNKKEDYDSVVTMGLPLSNTGKPVPSQARTTCGLM